MTARTRAAMKTQSTSLIDKTGSGGTSGADIESLQHDIADSATFPEDLATVATTGAYGDLSGAPTIPAELADLSDVDDTVGSPSDGDILVYRSAGTDWVLEAKPAAGSNPAIGDITDWPAGVTATEVGYLDGATSALQTQIDAKPAISSGAGAPASTPGKVGDIYVDTTGDDVYGAAGTASSADWVLLNDGAGGGSGDMLAATYDPAGIAEQVVGLTATQTLTNKTLTQPTFTFKHNTGTKATGEGVAEWDPTTNTLTIGNGSAATTILSSLHYSGDITVSSTGVATIAAGAVEFAMLDGAAVVTAAETIAANDNDTTIPTSAAVKAYADSVGSGDVTKVGTPVANRMAYWTGDGSLGHETGFTYDPSTDTLTVDKIVVTTGQLSNPGADRITGWDNSANAGAGSTAYFTPTGGIEISGTDVQIAAAYRVPGKQHLPIPAIAMTSRTTNGAARGTYETATNKVMRETLDFDSATEEFAQFAIQMPKNWDEGTVIAQAVWSHGSTTTNFGVAFGFSAVALANDDAADTAFGTEVVVTDTGGTTDDIYVTAESAAITVAGSPGAEEWVVFQVARKVANAADTMAVDARLIAVKIHYTVDAANVS